MTLVTIKADDGAGIYRFDGENHAGNPLVCAAVSSLFYAIAGYADQAEDLSLLDYTVNDGVFRVTFKASDRKIFDFCRFAFLQLSESFPENLRIYE